LTPLLHTTRRTKEKNASYKETLPEASLPPLSTPDPRGAAIATPWNRRPRVRSGRASDSPCISPFPPGGRKLCVARETGGGGWARGRCTTPDLAFGSLRKRPSGEAREWMGGGGGGGSGVSIAAAVAGHSGYRHRCSARRRTRSAHRSRRKASLLCRPVAQFPVTRISQTRRPQQVAAPNRKVYAP